MHTRIGKEHDVHIYKMVILYIIYFMVSYLDLMICIRKPHLSIDSKFESNNDRRLCHFIKCIRE